MENIFLRNIEYQIQETSFGVWRRYIYPTVAYFVEFKSHQIFLGLPLLHYTHGICPETGKRITAKGIIAVGRIAAGLVAIGQASFGVIARPACLKHPVWPGTTFDWLGNHWSGRHRY